jgi:Protein of unknown function (DUF1592)/Protein of unknown function (DUF1588)/Protein of unknown function (DUF1587)/Protein of unknown function (DUF1595)/Protein of unknown function (DUF1585)
VSRRLHRHALTVVGGVVLCVTIATRTNHATPGFVPAGVSTYAPVSVGPDGLMTPEAQTAMIEQYCLGCHDQWDAKGGLVLEQFNTAQPEQNGEIAEKMIRKLRAGLMPPVGEDRPDAATVRAFVTALEGRIDKAATAHPNPGRRPFQRLNRAEYENSVRALLALDVDVDAFLPPDTISHNFDNIADVQGFSPTLMEGYMRAARRISLDAMGDPGAPPTSVTYKVPRTESQAGHVDGTPLGTRGGVAVVHTFPADGEYSFQIQLHSSPTGQLFGLTARGEQIEVSINGARVALLDINPRMSESDPNGMNLETPKVKVKAGPQKVAAAFIQRFAGPVDDLMAPIQHTLADTQIGTAQGITTLPHLRDFSILGPYKVTGVSDTPSRRRILTCRPTSREEEEPCATEIITRLAGQAYRRPVDGTDLDGLMKFYEIGRKNGDFESGLRTALQAILASPNFVFRLEQQPPNARPDQPYRLTDLDLASRLSYFLWSTAPDAELMSLADKGTLRSPGVFEAQVRRMLADPRADAVATRFAGQWLHLQDLANMHPDALLYPQYDYSLGQLMRRETELFFNDIVRSDGNVLDLISADYTYVNARLAAHYGIPGVSGDNFRRVSLDGTVRRGLLGQGSILVLTSVADRTSPVIRGKWVMEVLLGTPPPPPPPNVPALAETKTVAEGRLLSVRERMEEHRKNPACASCHKMMDPIGLSLENYDVTGAWRVKDAGMPVDPTGQLWDGTPLDGPASLTKALLAHEDVILRNFTVNLLTFALGRRVEYYDMPTVRAIVRDAATSGNRFSSFVLGVVRSPAFQMSEAEAVQGGRR